MSERLSKEREDAIRMVAAKSSYDGLQWAHMCRELLAELDAVRAERDEANGRAKAQTRRLEEFAVWNDATGWLLREDLPELAQAREEGRREGAEQERAAVRAWLRRRFLYELAADIERGEHLKGGT